MGNRWVSPMVAAYGELPVDPAELRAFALSLQAELHAKTLHIEKLKAQLAALRRSRFGRSSEKLDREIRQLELLIEEIEHGVSSGFLSKTPFVGAIFPDTEGPTDGKSESRQEKNFRLRHPNWGARLPAC